MNNNSYEVVHMKNGGGTMTNNKVDVCKCSVIHEDVVEKVTKAMPSEDKLYDLAEFFKVFGDTTRIRIICALFESEMCVCDIAHTLNMSHSSISHQLRVLKNAKLVKPRREGKTVYYSLDDEHVQNIYDQGRLHLNHD